MRKVIVSKDAPYHSPLKRLKNIRQGQTLYKVYGLGSRSFMEKIFVNSRPKVHTTTTVYDQDFSSTFEYIFIDYEVLANPLPSSSLFSCGGYISNMSLQDCGIIPNNYNQHRTFTSKKKAKKYLEQCREEDLLSRAYEALTNELFLGI